MPEPRSLPKYTRFRHAMRESGRCIICGKPAATWPNGEPKSRCERHLAIANRRYQDRKQTEAAQ